MGCDIHLYIEYKNGDQWSNFGRRINPGRNYSLFGSLAGVRCESDHITPRGVPDDIGYSAFDDWSIYVSDTQTEDTRSEDGEYYYSRSHAEDYVRRGYCQWIERNGKKSWVTNCDWHTPSWLNTDEFELAIAVYLKSAGFQIGTLRLTCAESMDSITASNIGDAAKWALNGIAEYWAILAAMRCFEMQGKQARIVFWFDN